MAGSPTPVLQAKSKAMLEEISDVSRRELGPSLSDLPAVPFKVVRHAQLAVAVLFLVNGAAVGSWVPHIPERARALGLNPAQLGSVLLAAGIGALGAMPLSGVLLRRFGSRSVSLVAGLLFPALLSLAVLLPSIKLLVVVLFATGMSAACQDVAMNAHGVLVEALLRKRTISLLHAVFSVGCFAGAGINSVLMEQKVPDSVLVPSFGAVLLVMVFAVSVWMLPQAVERAHQAVGQGDKHAAKSGFHLPDSRLLLLGILCFSTMVSEGAMGDWSALLLRNVRHLGNGTSGYGYTCFAGFMVLGRFTGDAVVGRLGEQRTLRLGGAVSAAGLLMVLLLHPLSLVLVGFALIGAGLANASPVLYRTAATVPGCAPGEGLSTAVGVGYAGLLVGPPLLGFLGHAAGLPSIFWALLVLSVTLSAASPLVRQSWLRA